MAFRRVLLPIDGSDASYASIEAALKAAGPDGEVIALSVLPSDEQIGAATAEAAAAGRRTGIAAELTSQVLERHRREAREDLDRAAEAASALEGSISRRILRQGHPGSVILATAEELECDLIVVSTNGRSGWRRALLGSTSDHLVRHAERVPVLLVRRPE